MKYIVFDIDGVLADCSHRLHYIQGENKDYDKFYSYDEVLKDTPILNLKRILFNIQYANEEGSEIDIKFITARNIKCITATAEWLEKHFSIMVEEGDILMRPTNDWRPAHGKMDSDFNYYQERAIQYDTSRLAIDKETRYDGYMEKALGLAGETGEVMEKVKKMIRDKDGVFSPTPEDITELKKELGDVLWYLSALAFYNGIDLDDVARANLDKLRSRKERNQIHGSGDNR